MFDRWIADWPKTGKGARITLVILALLCFLMATMATLYDIQMHDSQGASEEIVALLFLLTCYIVWPYRIAWAVRRRGGNFNFWFGMAIVFSGFFVGIYYLFRWSRKPVIAEAS